VTAQRIIDYRAMHGQFYRVTDLLQVKGFGSKRLATVFVVRDAQRRDDGHR